MTHCFTDKEIENIDLEIQSVQLHLESRGIDAKEVGVLKVREAIKRSIDGAVNVRHVLTDEKHRTLSEILDFLRTELTDTEIVCHVEDAIRIMKGAETDVSL